MPIDTVQNLIHIRTNKNKKVMHNVARLWDISRQAHTPQDILDALHPWGENNNLVLNNFLPKLCIGLGAMSLIMGWFIHHYFPMVFTILIATFWFAIAYFSYESNEPVEQVIDELELKIKLLKYDLNFQKLPPHLSGTMNSMLVLGKLKQNFPLFNQGTESNDIVSFASTLWTDHEEQQHPILLFKYHYITEISVRDEQGNKYNVRKIEKDLWGCFLFETEALGFAASNRRSRLPHPYTTHWETADIDLNKKLNIYGYDQQQIARAITPSVTLRLSDLFENNQGDLIVHHDENILSFMTEHNIFNTVSRRDKGSIQNISDLRGYLRTLNMPNYEKFKQSMLNFVA